jgi:hypothetical protein
LSKVSNQRKISNADHQRRFGRSRFGHLRVTAALPGDLNILPETEVVGILEDAISTHQNASADDGKTDMHAAVAALINGILDGGNSVRRRK